VALNFSTVIADGREVYGAVSNWEARAKMVVISTDLQAALDTALDRSDQSIRQRFAALLRSDHSIWLSLGEGDKDSAAEDDLTPETLRDYREPCCTAAAPVVFGNRVKSPVLQSLFSRGDHVALPHRPQQVEFCHPP
jgi:hypothetical protein